MDGERGWWEEYRCGCVSETVRRKRDLVGYCPTHGENRRHVHPELPTRPTERPKEDDRG